MRGRRAFCVRARSGTDFVAGAAHSQGQVQISWQARRFRKVRIHRWIDRSNGKREREKDRDGGVNRVAGAALSQGRAQISWQARRFRKVRYRFRGRRSAFARPDFVAGAALSQGQVQIDSR